MVSQTELSCLVVGKDSVSKLEGPGSNATMSLTGSSMISNDREV